MFYKGNIKNAEGKEIQNGIQQATAKKLEGTWKEDFRLSMLTQIARLVWKVPVYSNLMTRMSMC